MTCFQRDRRSGLLNVLRTTARSSERFLYNKSAEPVCLVTFNYDLLLDGVLDCCGYKHPHIWTPSAARHRYPNAKQDQGHLRVSTSQIATLEQLLKSVTRVLMIGWRAREARFLPMLRDNLPGRGRGVSPCSRSKRRRRPPNAHSVHGRSRVSQIFVTAEFHRSRKSDYARWSAQGKFPAGLQCSGGGG
jgi:hypothetical protein